MVGHTSTMTEKRWIINLIHQTSVKSLYDSVILVTTSQGRSVTVTIARLNSGVPFPHRRKTWGAAADNEQLDGSGLLRRGDLSADLRGQVYNALVNSMIEGSYCLSNSQPAELTSTNTKNEYWHQRIAAVDGRPTAEGPVPESFDGRLPDPEITAWEHDSPAYAPATASLFSRDYYVTVTKAWASTGVGVRSATKCPARVYAHLLESMLTKRPSRHLASWLNLSVGSWAAESTEAVVVQGRRRRILALPINVRGSSILSRSDCDALQSNK